MKCPKCEGLMIPFKHYGFGTDLAGSFYGWHCVSCGDILDPVIVANRARSSQVAVGGKEPVIFEREGVLARRGPQRYSH